MYKSKLRSLLAAFIIPCCLMAQEVKPTKPAISISASMSDKVTRMAEDLVRSGFTAGDGYGEVWIRDLNTFITLSCKVNDKEQIRNHLIRFLQFQQADGGILDGYLPASKASGESVFYRSALAPDYLGHKNTVETDQETSLVQAVAKYIRATGDKEILQEKVAGKTIEKLLEKSLEFLLNERFNEQYGLLWGATTADWGDVQPEHGWGVVLDENSHLAIDIYDNAMFIIAIQDFLEIATLDTKQKARWESVLDGIKKNTQKHLWDEKANKYIPHIYLDGSPFPENFDESAVYYHGGTAVAIEAGLLDKDQVLHAYNRMQENVKMANAATIGLTLYPTYPEGSFQNKGMGPYSYQNGGDWTWFGGRMISQLIRYGFIKEAEEALYPMLDRVIKNNGFYEWYTPANEPKGSSSFRGEAGVLWSALQELETKKAARGSK
ncbi:GH36-type glycosyl hydrolase domain-containing protein [Sphingobacterium deserti]|uniref:Glycosyl hydrolase 94 catalytic domain-containing protein n=1 Tax=Sphingobacterium deserti TaxID=1229276 RepID=A0A0B8T354_9SPHI|nr:amylo-alpha-1,6-glucosidase [Sphingobacterium deserti]KGE13413.1 hypothetical protein DI53_2944 [Sphingobacterium deserti]